MGEIPDNTALFLREDMYKQLGSGMCFRAAFAVKKL